MSTPCACFGAERALAHVLVSTDAGLRVAESTGLPASLALIVHFDLPPRKVPLTSPATLCIVLTYAGVILPVPDCKCRLQARCRAQAMHQWHMASASPA